MFTATITTRYEDVALLQVTTYRLFGIPFARREQIIRF